MLPLPLAGIRYHCDGTAELDVLISQGRQMTTPGTSATSGPYRPLSYRLYV